MGSEKSNRVFPQLGGNNNIPVEIAKYVTLRILHFLKPSALKLFFIKFS